MMTARGWDFQSDRDGAVVWRRGKLWSLWDFMMNYGIYDLCRLIGNIATLERDFVYRSRMKDDAATQLITAAMATQRPEFEAYNTVTPTDIQYVTSLLEFVRHQAAGINAMRLQGVIDRVTLFSFKIQEHAKIRLSIHDFLAEVRALREAFESELPRKYLYLYPDDKAKMVLNTGLQWSDAIFAFPPAHADIYAAVDCYALGQNTASVFHSMRIVEHGLRELAAAVNVDFTVQQWHTAIEEIESTIREIGNRWHRSATKSELMSFYSGAAKEFFYFKDGWRNYVSHGGDPYDEHQALSVLEHVRTFMIHLSPRLGSPATPLCGS